MINTGLTMNKLQAKKGFECYGPLSEEKIIEMEKKLEIYFPENYKEFLRRYGYVEWFGHAIYGYSEHEEYCTVLCTLELRESKVPDDFERISKEGCVLETYSGGGYYFLFSNDSARSGQVALFIDELFGREAKSWETFEAFLEYMLSL